MLRLSLNRNLSPACRTSLPSAVAAKSNNCRIFQLATWLCNLCFICCRCCRFVLFCFVSQLLSLFLTFDPCWQRQATSDVNVSNMSNKGGLPNNATHTTHTHTHTRSHFVVARFWAVSGVVLCVSLNLVAFCCLHSACYVYYGHDFIKHLSISTAPFRLRPCASSCVGIKINTACQSHNENLTLGRAFS